jgi:hypothetical protein
MVSVEPATTLRRKGSDLWDSAASPGIFVRFDYRSMNDFKAKFEPAAIALARLSIGP